LAVRSHSALGDDFGPDSDVDVLRQSFPDGTPEKITFGVTEEHGIHFAPDGRSFVTSIGTSQSTVWVHDSIGTRQLSSEGYAFRPTISPDGRKVSRVAEDGTGMEKMIETSNILPFDASPDGQLVIAQDTRQWGSLKVFPRGQGAPMVVCDRCSPPQGTDPKPPDMSWAPNGRFVYLKFDGSTFAIPLRPKTMVPQIPRQGFRSKEQVAALPGARLVSEEPNVFPGPDPSIYAFTKVTTQRNIYRVPVH
jgi:hypothetical protein